MPFRFRGLHTLRIKETDRIQALKTEMGKLGYDLHVDADDQLSWDGTMNGLPTLQPDAPTAIDTYKDHRMALSFAPLALRRPIAINDPEVVSKSYPRYWDDLRSSEFIVNS